ncbi:hypothetical protein HOY80DRAFT_1008408 [Tuber brumale]|nr:hypothetical protein HOY80DRAFT_1008408 [Tuber brumale]
MTERGSCPSGYNWYVCALSAYQGCCRIDPCSLPSGCPSDSQLSSALPSGSGLRTTSTIAPSSNPGTVSPSATAGTPSVPPISPTTPPILPTLPTKPKESSLNPTPGFSTSGTAASGSSPSASSGSSKNSNGTNPVPQAIIVGVTIGGALVIVIIILIIILWRRRRESRDGLPGYSSELSPGGGAARGISSPAPNPSLNTLPLTKSRHSGAQWPFSLLHTHPPDPRRQNHNNAN